MSSTCSGCFITSGIITARQLRATLWHLCCRVPGQGPFPCHSWPQPGKQQGPESG